MHRSQLVFCAFYMTPDKVNKLKNAIFYKKKKKIKDCYLIKQIKLRKNKEPGVKFFLYLSNMKLVLHLSCPSMVSFTHSNFHS